MRLPIEMIPKPCWYKNLRTMLKKAYWDILRKAVYDQAGGMCEVCCEKGKLHAHEIWEYDDENNVQKLVGLVALCSRCHLVKHIGFAEVSDQIEIAKRQFCRVNECSIAVWEAAKTRALEQFNDRNKHEWKTDVSWAEKFKKIIDR